LALSTVLIFVFLPSVARNKHLFSDDSATYGLAFFTAPPVFFSLASFSFFSSSNKLDYFFFFSFSKKTVKKERNSLTLLKGDPHTSCLFVSHIQFVEFCEKRVVVQAHH